MNHPLSEARLRILKGKLMEEKDELESRFAASGNYGLHDSLRDSLDELSVNDNHPADLGTEMFERGKDLALNERAELRLRQVNEALERMAQGDYGLCVICDKEIPYDRLLAVPHTPYCLDHAEDKHVSNRRPVEEQIMSPPFGRTSLDELETSQNQFDGEDAWQAVASMGTSSSPAFSEDPEVANYNDMYIENDENVGYVEDIESFLATDLYGQQVMVVRNDAYRQYMDRGEGEGLLEQDPYETLD